jgi:ribosomal protein L11 methyltransferase
MAYKAVHIVCDEALADTLSFLLQEEGYLGTSYEKGKLIAYIENDKFSRDNLNLLLQKFDLIPEQVTDQPEQNWNKVWEDNFKSTDIGVNIHVRAPFQKSKNVAFDIVIHPKMAFGTGHHETTKLSALSLEQQNCNNAKVLDMGCGSGILAILASKMGAQKVVAIDYDIHSVENTVENVQLNAVNNVEILQSDNVTQLTDKFDIIISNIVKNINLRLLPQFVDKLNDSGTLILCGFLYSDLDELTKEAEAHKLKLIEYNIENNWLQTRFVKE